MVYIFVGIVIVVAAIYLFIRTKSRAPKVDEYDATWLVDAHKERQQNLANSEPFKARVKSLFGREPKWEEIFGVLNPEGDKTTNELLLQFRGPHLFAPTVAVNILEICFNKLEAESNPINSVTILRTALEEGDRIFSWNK